MNDRFCIISSTQMYYQLGRVYQQTYYSLKKGVLVSIVYHCAELIGGVIYLNLSVR